MRGSSSAAAAEYLNAGIRELYRTCGEFLRTDVEFVCDRVGKSCIRLGNDRQNGETANFIEHGEKLLRTERAVDAYRVSAETLEHCDHALSGNSGECAHILLEGHCHEHGLVGVFLCREDCCLDLVKVCHGLDDDDVSLASGEHELLVAVVSLLEFKRSGRLEELTYRTYIKRR